MTIVQISKIQHRSGNLVDLPQLDEAEFGWASDEKRLFIGKTTPNENIEVLTGYSQISFSQLDGTVGNLNINAITAQDGQVLTYDGTNWVNRGGSSGGLINLGDASNVKLLGGSIGYVLETDGLGNLAWTPKSAVSSYIENVTQASPGIVTTAEDNYFTNGAEVTITNVPGMTELNGGTYFVDVLTANTFALYADSALTTPVDTQGSNGFSEFAYTSVSETALTAITVGDASLFSVNQPVRFVGDLEESNLQNNVTYYIKTITLPDEVTVSTELLPNGVAGNVVPLTPDASLSASMYAVGGRAISSISATSGTAAAGSQYSIQFNSTNVLAGDADFSYNFVSKLMTLNGNANVGNLNATGISTATRFISNIATGTSPFQVSSTTRVANLNVATAGTADTAGTVTTAAQPNITSVGTLTTLTVSGNATVGGIKTDNYYYANGAAISFAGTYSNANVASYLPTYTGTVSATALTTGANTTAGTVTGNWTLTAGSRLQATYADLAEYYRADKQYEPGTVLEFGGEYEVTLADDETNRVAGVVTTNPAYVMNSNCPGEAVAIALQGRVPCKVRGNIRKGDMLVSGGSGYARPTFSPKMGTVIGKALEDYSGTDGIIEVAVGRL